MTELNNSSPLFTMITAICSKIGDYYKEVVSCKGRWNKG
ncbi:hypothetical protein SAMN04489757_10836 [Anaerocolumna aminovalerica]|jgi:hypothetical protein|uniref:Uncharacterized protein n=1 Tax=Anaerocolumna aminovalerica TaxID=1527 RepID=A0A1I5E6D1_9FIRM|nr:hypothetical protein SAMN04489757_10836 [Anaerocolumna aminovalerica]